MTNERDKKYFVRLEDAENGVKEGSDIPEDSSGQVIRGLSSPTKKALSLKDMARYLHEVTSESTRSSPKNNYAINDGVQKLELNDDTGQPAAINSGGAGADVFDSLNLLDQLGVIGQYFDKQTLQELADPELGFQEFLLKAVPEGSSIPQQYDKTGKARLPDPKNATQIQKKVSKILETNRFHPGNSTPFVPRGTDEGIDAISIGRSQTQFGRHIPAAEGRSESGNITFDQMKKLGLALMIRSAGEFVSRDGDPTSATVGLAALLPGEAQLGATKLNTKSLLAKNQSTAQGAPLGLSERSSLESELALADTQGSYGQLNTFLEPFGGFLPTGMAALGIALVTAVKLLVEGFTALFGLGTDFDSISSPAENHPAPLGAYVSRNRGQAGGGLISLHDIGVNPVNHDFGIAVSRGIDAFFDFDGTDFVRVSKSPGYYVVMIRAIIRSSGEVIRDIVDVSRQGNIIAAAQAILGVVDLLKSSKIIGFLNILAQLGDNVLTLEDEGFLSGDGFGVGARTTNIPNNGKISTIDKIIPNAASRIMKSRENQNEIPLIWRTSSTPSSILIPDSIIRARVGLNSQTPLGPTVKPFIDNAQFTGKRISQDAVKEIEDKLDSEYVPFYFHDLRTGEIISFHAFVSSITDGYTVGWENETGPGRVDDVMIYKNTKRALSLSFWIVSTSIEDFDAMWWKINKLTTLVFPQWSAGRQLKVNDNKFVQPFSQIPTSSPIIRIRFGDVIRSNYSKLALARLFGAGSKDKFALARQGEIDTERAKEALEKAANRLAQMKIDPINSTKDSAGYKVQDQAFLKVGKPPKGVPPVVSVPASASGNGIRLRGYSQRLPVKITKVLNNQSTPEGLPFTAYHMNLIDPPKGFSAGPYIVPHAMLEPDAKFTHDQAREQQADSQTQTPEQEAISDFFKASNNVVVRSFESTMGRGLAGAITSLNFDWHKARWETTKIGSRAPQWCEVKINFQPIHDIAPGIDSDGFNRAPVYGVGEASRAISPDPYAGSSQGDDETSEKLFEENHNKAQSLIRPFSGRPLGG